ELAGCFKQYECAVGVHAEIGVRILRGPVVRRLRGGMHDEFNITAIIGKHRLDRPTIPNIDVKVNVIQDLRFQFTPAPFRRGVLPEKLLSHVVVDADDPKSLRAEESDGLGTNQSSRSGDYTGFHKK